MMGNQAEEKKEDASKRSVVANDDNERSRLVSTSKKKVRKYEKKSRQGQWLLVRAKQVKDREKERERQK